MFVVRLFRPVSYFHFLFLIVNDVKQLESTGLIFKGLHCLICVLVYNPYMKRNLALGYEDMNRDEVQKRQFLLHTKKVEVNPGRWGVSCRSEGKKSTRD